MMRMLEHVLPWPISRLQSDEQERPRASQLHYPLAIGSIEKEKQSISL